MRVTISDVAERAGVSITTVSRVINNNYPVKPETRVRVESAVAELGFVPNILARGLIQRKSFAVGVLVPSITNIFFPVVVSGIQDTLTPHGYQILLCDTGGDPASEAAALESLLERQVDGVISVDPRSSLIKNGHYARVAESSPLILINGYNDRIKLNFVQNDQEDGARRALEYLIGLGHRRILLMRGRRSFSYDLKEQVYAEVLEEHGLEPDPRNILHVENGNSVETLDASAEALKKAFSERDIPLPAAVFACNDWMAAGVIQGAAGLGLSVPGDISVVGYDNTIIAQMTVPRLTTVDQNMRSLGRVAAERLHELMRVGGEGSFRVTLDTRLVVRDSCRDVT